MRVQRVILLPEIEDKLSQKHDVLAFVLDANKELRPKRIEEVDEVLYKINFQ